MNLTDLARTVDLIARVATATAHFLEDLSKEIDA